MALAEALHHSRDVRSEQHEALLGQKTARATVEFFAMTESEDSDAGEAGSRPPSLGEPPGPAVKVGRRQQSGFIEQLSLDVPVLQVPDDEVPQVPR